LKKISILVFLILISLFSYSQKIDINIGLSNQTGTSSPHFSYGFLCDLDFRITKRISIYTGLEVNYINHIQKGIVFTDPYGYAGVFSVDHTYAFYCIPFILTYRMYSFGKLSINGKVGTLNSFLYDNFYGNPDSNGIYRHRTEKKGFILFGLVGISLDYMFSEKTGIFITEQFLGSQKYSGDGDKGYFNTQVGIKYRIK
jgi:hypothetical protein